MTFRFYKQTRWFEVYFEVQKERILDRFYDYRLLECGSHEYWIGRCYLTYFVYGRRKKKVAAEGGEAAQARLRF